VCDYCLKHGAGKRWYLNADNYRKNFERDEKRENFTQEFTDSFKRAYEERLKGVAADVLPARTDWLTRTFLNRYFAKQHTGQVVPFEEAQAVVDVAGQVSLIPCVCRMASEGRKVRLCMPFMTIPEEYFNDSHSEGRDVEKLTLEEAKVKDFYLKGYVQSIWTFMTPHIGALCNCDYPSCAAIRARRTRPGTRSILKSEFMAKIDQDACTGCGVCIEKCQFGAINLSLTQGRAYINRRECFGCGVCRSVCPSNAISIESRLEDPVVAKLW